MWKERKKEGGRKEGRQEGRKAGRQEGRKEARKEGRKEAREKGEERKNDNILFIFKAIFLGFLCFVLVGSLLSPTLNWFTLAVLFVSL